MQFPGGKIANAGYSSKKNRKNRAKTLAILQKYDTIYYVTL